MINYTTEQLVKRWEDYNEIENIMGRLTYNEIVKKSDYIWDTFWCKNMPDPCLGFNNGYYKGYDAIGEYYSALKDLDIIKAKVAQKIHPEELGSVAPEDIRGVGGINVLNFTTPVIELAADGKTAKGMWYLMGGSGDFYTEEGPRGTNRWGRVAVDFIREDTGWKIWHMLVVLDIDSKMGSNWADTAGKIVDPTYKKITEFSMPAPNVPQNVYELYHSRRRIKAFPKVPRPYTTFSTTFSYGV